MTFTESEPDPKPETPNYQNNELMLSNYSKLGDSVGENPKNSVDDDTIQLREIYKAKKSIIEVVEEPVEGIASQYHPNLRPKNRVFRPISRF